VTVLAVDWSGRRSGEHRYLWTAEAAGGALQRLEGGRGRVEVVDELVGRVAERPGLVVGFDFSFSLPAWFLDARGWLGARDLWDAATVDGERWLDHCEPPFWGRPGRPRPRLADDLRRTEREATAVGGIRPKSTFQVGGAGSVGTGSVRGFPALARLQDAGWAIWPFDAPAEPPVVVEVWPRAFTGPVVKSDESARAAHLDALHPRLDPGLRRVAMGSEDAFDAALTAIGMSRHETTLRSLPARDDAVVRREGWIWSVPVRLRTTSARARCAPARPTRRSPV
jgi:hypothetical protein